MIAPRLATFRYASFALFFASLASACGGNDPATQATTSAPDVVFGDTGSGDTVAATDATATTTDTTTVDTRDTTAATTSRPDTTADTTPDTTADTRPADTIQDTAHDTGPVCNTVPNPWHPPTDTLPWRHADWAVNAMQAGAANHRGQDIIVLKGAPQVLSGVFKYGLLDQPMVDETVQIYLQREVPCGTWDHLGDFRTSTSGQYTGQFGVEDRGGRVFFQIPDDQQLPVGRYPVRMVLMGDLSEADFDLIVVDWGTQAIVSDIDGTLTTGDDELILELLKDIFQETYEQQMYADADTVMKAWYDKGYLLVFVTGRPDLLRRMTEHWIEPRFPPAALHLTNTLSEASANNDHVGAYKLAYLDYLKAQGLDIVAVYGNATTDIYAYEQTGIPKNRTFIAGTHKGDSGTVAIDTYTDHLVWAQMQPSATTPPPPAFGWW